MATQYPGRIVKKGEANAELVGQIQAVLKAAGYACFANGVFDETMESAVRLFQAQHFDQQGHALIADGQVGPLTWARLFRVVVSAPAALPNSLASRALAVARGEIGTREVPEGSNRGPQVDLYLDVRLLVFQISCQKRVNDQPASEDCERIESVDKISEHSKVPACNESSSAGQSRINPPWNDLHSRSRWWCGPHRVCRTCRVRAAIHHRGKHRRWCCARSKRHRRFRYQSKKNNRH
jgi:hypothetical protein